MKTGFRASFLHDIESITEEKIRQKVLGVIKEAEAAHRLMEIHNLKKLRERTIVIESGLENIASD